MCLLFAAFVTTPGSELAGAARKLRAEVPSNRKQMDIENMDQIVFTLQSPAKGKASAVQAQF